MNAQGCLGEKLFQEALFLRCLGTCVDAIKIRHWTDVVYEQRRWSLVNARVTDC